MNPPADIAAALDAPHRDPDGTYFNPWRRFPVRFLDVLRWKLSPNPYRGAPKPPVPRVANDGAYLLRVGEPDSITWVGHSTFAIHDGGDLVLTDPHWGPRALVPPRLAPPGIPLEAAAGAKFAVLSHDHYDHLDAWTVRRLPAALPWFVPPGLGAWFRRRGRQAVELDWWQSARVGRFEITAVPVQHWSRRTFRPNRALWCGWMIESDHRRYFFAGDTGYFNGFSEIGRRFSPIDVALLSIGAYEPRWFMAYQHMDPEEAYRAFLDLGARFLLPMHWGVFDLTDEPVGLAPRVLAQVLAARGGDPRVRTLAIGERWLPPA
ncbi:MAG TPA: MBL fold metallo-hydrolase [Thermoanaerobaculia bacterium]|nr:MBL fold metallo-hydrolase [Thermoanaerobaculia bacterium]